MFRRIFLFSAVAAGLSCFEAAAAARPDAMQPAAAPAEGIRLAQGRDVEIYHDRYGRQVIVDAYTGEILAVQRPRRDSERYRPRQRAWRGPREQERFYLNDPDDMRRLDQIKRGEGGFGGRYSYEGPRESYNNAFPEPPPDVVSRQPVKRAPLQQPRAAKPSGKSPDTIVDQPAAPAFTARDDVAALQVLLDRRGASPGVIDGRFGSNVDKALEAYRDITGENLRSTDAEGIRKALATTGGDAFKQYTITAEDAAGPFVASVPADYGEKAKLERLGYTSVSEMLAERFHMDEAYLKALNPDAAFNRPGTIIRVANVGEPVTQPVTRIVADKSAKQVRAYDAAGKLVAAYPATIGSTDTPSPTGVHRISRIAFDPEYTYNPNLNFKQGDNNKILTIPPGPNGPVGSIWIALDKPTYGIHGTPEPSKIGKTESHGCVRLTNWDAAELAKLVQKDVPVDFVE